VPGVLLLLLAFPILVWAGTTLGSRSVVLASFLIVWSAALATSSGAGPFVTGTHTDQTALLWAYSILVGSTALTLAVLAEQRDFATRRRKAEELERLRADRDAMLLLERERLTREMHDGLGGQLVSLLSVVERGVGSRSEIAEGLRRALDDIRIAIDALDPHSTDLPTALGKLRSRLEPLLRRNGVELVWKIDADARLGQLDSDEVLHLLRIIQEGVTNALRHADASRVEVELGVEAGDANTAELQLAIRDDGSGFSQTRVPSGRGIRSMHARARELGAQLRIEGADAGTRIDLCLPIPIAGRTS